MVASRDTFPLLAELLADQQRLQTPIARFSDLAAITPALAPVYRDLIPLTAPAPGEQYAFEVDLDACSGCKACVAGCHSLNGLDENETWRDVGVVLGTQAGHPFQQTITSACHHCADPACMNGCPVLAYEKDPITGIVRHLDDQCIGCSYCVLKCPYDVPKYSERLGIVRKCDMCHGRLAAGEAPACVQACPTHAIRIVKVPVENGPHGRVADTTHFLSAAPSPDYTQPTTRYVSTRGLPKKLVAADAATPRAQPAHWPLVFLLVFTQIGAGLLAAQVFGNADSRAVLWSGAIFFALGVGASVAHLGRPLRAWRIFLGWRKSWLSREALVLGAAAGAVAGGLAWPGEGGERLLQAGLLTAFAGIFCSAMIYVDTRRRLWAGEQTWVRMGGTVAIAATWWTLPALAVTLFLGKLIVEMATLAPESIQGKLQRGPLRRLCFGRFTFAAIALASMTTAKPVYTFAMFLVGELLERALYFRAVDAPKMLGMGGRAK